MLISTDFHEMQAVVMINLNKALSLPSPVDWATLTPTHTFGFALKPAHRRADFPPSALFQTRADRGFSDEGM
jgi:hypothetical protein